MQNRRRRHILLLSCVTCGGGEASDGSSGSETAETGANEEGGEDGGLDPGPVGQGCEQPWEGWWDAVCTDSSVGTYVAASCDEPIEFIFNDTARCCCES